MSVWKSGEKPPILAQLISPSKILICEKQYQALDTSKFVIKKYSAERRIFNSLLGVSSGDETLRLIFDILHEHALLILLCNII